MPSASRLKTLSPLLAPGAVIVYLGFAASGPAAGVAALVSVALTLALVVRLDTAGPRERTVMRLAGAAAIAALPGALLVYLGFRAGGYFPGTTGFAALLLAVLLAGRIALAGDALRAPPAAVRTAAIALVALAAWALLSPIWSGAPERALLDVQRILLYVTALLLFASWATDPARLRWMLRSWALGALVVSGAGLLTRLFPTTFPTAPTPFDDRLTYPLTYWNAVGLLATFGLLLCVHLASDLEEHRVVRALGAAAAPLFAATLIFSFSRGAILVGAVALVAYAIAAANRGLITGLLSTLPPAIVAAVFGFEAWALATKDPRSAIAVTQGRQVALVVLACMAAGALVRVLAFRLDAGLARLDMPRRPPIRTLAAVGVAALLAIVVVGIASGRAGDLYERLSADPPGDASAVGERLTSAGSQGRIAQWRVAVADFQDSPVLGGGSGTWALSWSRDRPENDPSLDAHSLYLESLGELGFPGFALIVVAVAALLIGTAARCSGRGAAPFAAAFALALAWAMHAAIDWDWEMPALTLPMMAVAAAAIATVRPAPEEAASAERGAWALRPRVLAFALAGATALLAASVIASEARLRTAMRAIGTGDCHATIEAASDSSTIALGMRPEPKLLVGWCEAALGRETESVGAIRSAIDQDPGNWVGYYALGVVQAHFGDDPGPAAARAFELNRLQPQTVELKEKLAAAADPDDWAHVAETSSVMTNPNGPLVGFGGLADAPR